MEDVRQINAILLTWIALDFEWPILSAFRVNVITNDGVRGLWQVGKHVVEGECERVSPWEMELDLDEQERRQEEARRQAGASKRAARAMHRWRQFKRN